MSKTPAKRIANSRRWNQTHREQYNANGRRWYANHAEDKKAKERARTIGKYGITMEDYNRMLAEQKGMCAICSRPERSRLRIGGVIRSLAVDHDHKTGEVRGLLCEACNRSIAQLGEDPKILRSAAEYLEHHEIMMELKSEYERA